MKLFTWCFENHKFLTKFSTKFHLEKNGIPIIVSLNYTDHNSTWDSHVSLWKIEGKKLTPVWCHILTQKFRQLLKTDGFFSSLSTLHVLFLRIFTKLEKIFHEHSEMSINKNNHCFCINKPISAMMTSNLNQNVNSNHLIKNIFCEQG